MELNTENPPVIKLYRYFESPAAACVALGILQATLTKMIHDGNVRSVEIGRTRLIEDRVPRCGVGAASILALSGEFGRRLRLPRRAT